MISCLIPLTACDANTGANGTACSKCHVSPHFDHCEPINAMMPLTTALASQGYV